MMCHSQGPGGSQGLSGPRGDSGPPGSPGLHGNVQRSQGHCSFTPEEQEMIYQPQITGCDVLKEILGHYSSINQEV